MKELTEYDSREHVVAMLQAAGKYDVPEIARVLALKPSDVYKLLESEAFQGLVQHYATRFTPAELDEVRALLNRDAPANFEFLRGVRAGDIIEDPKILALRLQAAKTLFDNQVEKRVANESGPRIVFNFTVEAVQSLKKLMLEDDAEVIDVEAE